jgi:hypothetical protein
VLAAHTPVLTLDLMAEGADAACPAAVSCVAGVRQITRRRGGAARW